MMTAGHLIISGESRLFREGLRRILQGPAITVVGEASSLQIAFGLLDLNAPPDLILCDPSADLDTEFSIMRQIADEFPTVSVVVITNDLRHSLLDRAVESGARGFLPQDLSPAALEMLLKLVLMGENIFPGPQHLLAELRDDIRRAHDPNKTLTAPLSQKESEVLECLGNGMPNKVIARNLNIAEATVKVHIKSLMRKINVRNRTQAAIWSISQRPDSGAEPVHH
jgi:two-component system nitrate/nitrite response regulator NarL